MTRNNFRKLLLFQLALDILTLLVGLSDFSLGVPESIRQAETLYEESKLDSKSRPELWLMFGSYCLGLVAIFGGLIGLYFFKRWGILLSVLTVIVVVPVLNYSLDFELNDWVVATLTYWSAVSTGFIISVALLTSINHEFK
jgi:phage-related holin